MKQNILQLITNFKPQLRHNISKTHQAYNRLTKDLLKFSSKLVNE